MLRVRAAKMTTYNVDAFPEIKDVQRVELYILIKVARLCEERGFTYFIESGTALGAVRHGGFIPWDDDIDIGMPRQDYEKFLDIAQEELGDEYFVQTRKTDPNAPFSFAKVRKNGTTFIEWNKRNIKMHHGIYIDIFPYDGLPIEGLDEHIDKCLKLNKLQFKKYIPDRVGVPQKSLKWKLGAAARRMQYYLLKLYPESLLEGKIKKEYMRYDTNPNEHGFCTCFSFVDRIIFPNELLFPPQKINFEGEEFYAPAKLEEYLTLMYGDYNQLPLVEDRVGHRPVEVSVTEELFTR